MKELWDCPFCGGEVRYQIDIEMIPTGVICNQCRAVVRFLGMKPLRPTDKMERRTSWIRERWNRRATDE